ncbi:hypothetical protein GTR04_0934 [Trichophyton interdigitale]|uniref:Uncharacterized protein n=1 Tax=Trichophyton interdigitale TaxID=101480 RepID=A0A9P4YPL2_9EURO|nr:hypothetical protein GY631_0643 [Trichophyton interdigitale]KAF3900773.1 hypothetical protein GY632_0559 [Trichophyton interdigitale]KAG8211727.1 hypothetical protein GTR04_0934 [Trichophyton interdigitale]
MLETAVRRGTAKEAIDYLSWLLFPVLTGIVLHYFPQLDSWARGKLAKRRVGDAENPEPDRQTQTIRPVAKGVKAFRPLSSERGPKVSLGGFMARCQVFIASETQARAELRKTLKGIRTALEARQHSGHPMASAVAAPETTTAEVGASTTEDQAPEEVRPPDAAVPVPANLEVPAPEVVADGVVNPRPTIHCCPRVRAPRRGRVISRRIKRFIRGILRSGER